MHGLLDRGVVTQKLSNKTRQQLLTSTIHVKNGEPSLDGSGSAKGTLTGVIVIVLNQ